MFCFIYDRSGIVASVLRRSDPIEEEKPPNKVVKWPDWWESPQKRTAAGDRSIDGEAGKKKEKKTSMNGGEFEEQNEKMIRGIVCECVSTIEKRERKGALTED